MRIHLSTAALAAAFALAVCVPVGAQGTGGSPGHMMQKPHMGGAMMMTKTPVSIPLNALNGSGESGNAVLRDTPAGLSVVLTLKGFPAGPQPAHIHKGTCAQLDPKPEYPLTSVVAGKSTTVVKGVTIAKLLASPNAINVHKSTKEIPVYVSCGNIAAGKKSMM
jgi:hypothetical protein